MSDRSPDDGGPSTVPAHHGPDGALYLTTHIGGGGGSILRVIPR